LVFRLFIREAEVGPARRWASAGEPLVGFAPSRPPRVKEEIGPARVAVSLLGRKTEGG